MRRFPLVYTSYHTHTLIAPSTEHLCWLPFISFYTSVFLPAQSLQVLEARLRDDKKKTEDLICSIFPAKVAHCLLKDLPVEAEQFPMISCLFSDIVGFTALCSNENVVPMDIIRLLNRLYVQFDALTNIHQVYKVGLVV